MQISLKQAIWYIITDDFHCIKDSIVDLVLPSTIGKICQNRYVQYFSLKENLEKHVRVCETWKQTQHISNAVFLTYLLTEFSPTFLTHLMYCILNNVL